jgi:hypothetical protein
VSSAIRYYFTVLPVTPTRSSPAACTTRFTPFTSLMIRVATDAIAGWRPMSDSNFKQRITKDEFQARGGYAFALPRRETPGLCIKCAPLKTEGAGKTGCPPHPWSACNKKARGRTTGTGGSSGLPCAMVLTVSFVLSPVTMLGCHRRPRDASASSQT